MLYNFGELTFTWQAIDTNSFARSIWSLNIWSLNCKWHEVQKNIATRISLSLFPKLHCWWTSGLSWGVDFPVCKSTACSRVPGWEWTSRAVSTGGFLEKWWLKAFYVSFLNPQLELAGNPYGASLCPGCFTSIQLLVYGLGRQQRVVQVLRLHQCGRPHCGVVWSRETTVSIRTYLG